MSENQGLDISRVVSLIMENPALIEQISNLARSSASDTTDIPPIKEESEPAVENTPTPASAEPTYLPPQHQQTDRARLFGALKPYVSKERAKAIDSMLTIAEILDMMKAR